MAMELRVRSLESENEKLRSEIEAAQKSIIDRTELFDKRIGLLEEGRNPLSNRPPFIIPEFPMKLYELGLAPPTES